MKRYCFSLIVLLFSVACSRNSITTSEKESFKSNDLLNYAVYGMEMEKHLSFPILFKKEVVKEAQIRTIIRRIYSVDADDKVTRRLREKRVYSFDQIGNLKRLYLYYYLDSQKIGTLIFDYKSTPDKFGFARVERSPLTGEVAMEGKKLDFQYYIHDQISYSSKCLTYRNRSKGTFLYCFQNVHFSGPLSVDSIAHPRLRDQVLIGTPVVPEKKYQVDNVVHEFNVIEWEKTSKEAVSKIKFSSNPFHTVRTYEWSNSGFVISFVDSLYASSEFIQRTEARMIRNKQNLPTSIAFTNGSSRTKRITHIEKIGYEYFKK